MPELLHGDMEGISSASDKALVTFGTNANLNRRGVYQADSIQNISWSSGGEIWVMAKFVSGPSTSELIGIRDAMGNRLCAASPTTLVAVDGNSIASQTLLTFALPLTTDFVLCFTRLADGFRLRLFVGGSPYYDANISAPAPLWGEPAFVSYGQNMRYSNLGHSADPLVGVQQSTLVASADGFHTDMTGDYTSFSELGVDLTSVCAASAVGQKQSAIYNPITGKTFTGSAIQGIGFGALIVTDALSGITGFRPFIRTGGVDYNSGDVLPASAIMSPTYVHWTTNPATGSRFTAAELNGPLELGFEAV